MSHTQELFAKGLPGEDKHCVCRVAAHRDGLYSVFLHLGKFGSFGSLDLSRDDIAVAAANLNKFLADTENF